MYLSDFIFQIPANSVLAHSPEFSQLANTNVSAELLERVYQIETPHYIDVQFDGEAKVVWITTGDE